MHGTWPLLAIQLYIGKSLINIINKPAGTGNKTIRVNHLRPNGEFLQTSLFTLLIHKQSSYVCNRVRC